MENEAFQGNVSGGYPTVSQNRDTEADTSSPRISDTISDRPVVSSPTREDWGLEAELQTLQNGGLVGESSRTAGTGEVTSQRSGSIRSTTSDNPLYRIPERFRSANASFSSSVPSLLDTPVDSFLGQDETRSATASYSSRMGQGSLPADDGMSLLRKRIIEIREMEGSSTEKARLMHEVMTKQHNSSQASLHAPQMHRPQSPASLMSQDGGPLTPHSSHSGVEYIHNLPTPTSVSPIAEIDNPYRLTADALQPSFVPVPISPPIHTNSANGRRASLSFELNSSMEDERRSLGCQHYKRNVKCDSYNTAQMQILSGPDPEIAAEGVELDSAVAESEPNQGPPSTIPHPNLRGRSSRGAAQTHLGSPNARRPTSSASATDNIRFSPYPIPQRAGRSVSPMRNVEGDPSLAGTHVSDSVATEEIEIEEEGDEGNQDDDDEEEVDFWGGDGHRNQHVRKDGEEECDEDSEGNESDTEIDTDEEADDAENDRMEVFGHR
ncbi:MAG: hypothetical protein M1827_005424 [Pycnora praestabilis]|nr:MAG: hypothetical protein M1827_005424 [Pycnora praestabilis]